LTTEPVLILKGGNFPCRKLIISYTDIAAPTNHKMQEIFVHYIPGDKKMFFGLSRMKFHINILNISGATCFN